jgi:hypothetical protein
MAQYALLVAVDCAPLGTIKSTISREVQRNGGSDGYRAARSDQAAWDNALLLVWRVLVTTDEMTTRIGSIDYGTLGGTTRQRTPQGLNSATALLSRLNLACTVRRLQPQEGVRSVVFILWFLLFRIGPAAGNTYEER